MTKKIFKGILFTSLVTMLACLVIIIGAQYRFYSDAQINSIKNEAYIISCALENGTDIKSFKDSVEHITLIDSDGLVIFDNTTATSLAADQIDSTEIEDEVEEANGSSSGHLDTISTHTYYHALELSDGKILRVANTRSSLFTVILQMLPLISAIIVFTSIMALFLASVISKNVLKPVNSIDPENPDAASPYEEIAPLVKKLRYQKNRINSQISQLTQSRQEFEIISANMSEGMLLTDIGGVILTHNKSIEKLFGITENINGKNILTLGSDEIFDNVFGSIAKAKHTEFIHYTDNHSYQVIVNPVLDEITGPCGAVVLVMDVTEKQEQEKFRREFTANVSHELKTPLTSILGFSEILKEGIAAPEDVKGFGEDINRETKRLISLVNNIIQLSRLDEGILPKEEEKVDLKSSALEVAGCISPIAMSQNISISVSGESAVINAHSYLIFEMLYNLCDNAVKYNREGGSVKIITGNKNGKPFVSVKDTGIGIPPEHHSRIFERFYRLEKSRTNTKGGTGLGLSIVKHIASVSGGTIILESVPDKGTEITVLF